MKFTEVAQPLPMAVPIANAGDKNLIPLNSTKTNLASLNDGFPDITQKSADEGGLPPVRADFNGMFYLSTDQRIYLQNGGIITFSQSVSDEIGGYPKGAVLDFVDEKVHSYTKVRSLIDDNTYNFVKDVSFIDGIHWENLKFGSSGSGLDLATIVCMPFGIDESENKYRYLNGQVLIQSQYPAFTAKVKSWQSTRTDLFATEQNWQAEKTTSKLGQCGKFVIDDEAGTIRLPLVININGLTDLANCGVLKDESLPNVTGHIQNVGVQYDNLSYSGTFKNSVDLGRPNNWAMYDPNVNWAKLVNVQFSASSSSSTYQDNAPVQQEAIQYPYVIVVNTGVEEAERPINNYQVNNVYSYGMSTYYKGTMNNNSWLRSAGQWNSGTVYNGIYNWAVAQQVAEVDGFKKSTDSDISDYDFVVNTEEQTFRLPLKNGQEGVFADKVKGNGITLGLTDGVKLLGLEAYHSNYDFLTTNTKLYGLNIGSTSSSVTRSSGGAAGLTTDSSKSGIVVDLTIPSGYNLYYYIGDTLQNTDLINIARLGESLSGKTDKAQAAHAAMPSDKYIDLTLGAELTKYTAPADGWFFVNATTSGQGMIGFQESETIANKSTYSWVATSNGVSTYLPVKKGESTLLRAINIVKGTLKFYYAVGSEPEE